MSPERGVPATPLNMAKDDPIWQPRHREAAGTSYWATSRRPLQILVFLLPLVVLYELGLALLLRSESGIITNKAHESLLRFFDAFGINASSGLFLGGLAIVIVLLVWHLLVREPWKVDLAAAGLMALESLVLVAPLLVIGRIVSQVAGLAGVAAALPSTAPGVALSDLDPWSEVAISVGAGLYEELLFRMMLIAALHTLLVDVGKASHRVGTGIALVVSSAAFAAYHPLADATGGFSFSRLIFYFLAGLYFGAVYIVRGFGVVVAVHAFYDILTFAISHDGGP